MSEKKCKYLGENWGDCWRVSGNIFQKCISKNKEKCILLKNEQLHDKIDNLEQQLQTAKEENEKLKKVADIAMKMKVTWDELDKVNESIINTLTQQNKRLREALEAISKAHSETIPRIMQYAQQAIKGVE